MPIEEPPQTVICVPGLWKNQAELRDQIAKLSDGYLFADPVLTHRRSGDWFTMEVCPHNPEMAGTFRKAGPHWRDTIEMAKIKDHKMVIFLSGAGGSQARAEAFMHAAAGLIRAGGLGVKIESTGLAHSPAAWMRFMEGTPSTHYAFVVYLTGNPTFSCGMHNLGLRDAIIDKEHSEDPVELLRTFTRYDFEEKPTMFPGNTFSASEDGPRYRLSHEAESPYGPESLFHNPYGMWRLSPA